MIAARQIVVLYGKSGMGKSSLLNAGIIPLLENELSQKPKYFSVRLFNKGQESNATFVPPLQTLIKTVSENATEKEWLKPLKADVYPKGELWYWLKQWQIACPRVPIILFFDQFEELFSYSDTEIEAFGEELRTLIYQNIPDYISKGTSLTAFEQTAFAQQSEKEREEKEKQIDAIYEKIDIKLVFSIRSDRMALLNKLTRYIPNILKHFYELDALTESEARQAIIKPAQLQDQAYVSMPFDYEPSIVEAIIKQVKNQYNGKIKTATLQIVCSYIEQQKVIEERQNLINANVLGNIQHIFRDFYQRTLNKLNAKDQALVSKAIEEIFIQNNQRIPFEAGYLRIVYHLSQTVLDELEKSTLLSKERDIAGRFIYQIGHDTLIEPIVEFANERKAKEEQRQLEEAQKQQAEEAKRQQAIQALENKNLQQALDARKQLLNYAVIAGIVLIGLLVFSFILWRKAEEEKLKANNAEIQAKNAQQKAQQALHQVYYQQAKAFKDNADNILYNGSIFKKEARVFYDSAMVLLQKIPYPDTLGTGLKKEIEQLQR